MNYPNSVKRYLDVALATGLLVFALPVGLVVALLIKLESRGPVLFVQQRTGLGGESFKLYKFRSMARNNDVRDLSHADKITRLGKFLRACSLDEIPQLLNVLRGDMSFIGPRPWIPEYYSNMNIVQRRRNNVVPGITGLAQAYGRNSLTIDQKIAYDLDYVESVSLLTDIKIIFVTLAVLFDKTAQEMGKHSIEHELRTLQYQNDGNNFSGGAS